MRDSGVLLGGLRKTRWALSGFPQAEGVTLCCHPCLLSTDLDFLFLRQKVESRRQGNPNLASQKFLMLSEDPSA